MTLFRWTQDARRAPQVSLVVLVLAIAALGLLTGCDDETVGPQTRGAIDGQVLDARTEEPVARANITTSPPSQSVLTDDNGEFVLDDIPTGNYTIEADKSQFEPGATTVSVEAGDTTRATILLERTDDFGDTQDSLAVAVTDLFNERVNRDSTGADSIFANVEYEAHNAGEVEITTYEILFKVVTDAAVLSQEEGGDTLHVGEFDVGSFRRFVRESPATDVRVEDVFLRTK